MILENWRSESVIIKKQKTTMCAGHVIMQSQEPYRTWHFFYPSKRQFGMGNAGYGNEIHEF